MPVSTGEGNFAVYAPAGAPENGVPSVSPTIAPTSAPIARCRRCRIIHTPALRALTTHTVVREAHTVTHCVRSERSADGLGRTPASVVIGAAEH